MPRARTYQLLVQEHQLHQHLSAIISGQTALQLILVPVLSLVPTLPPYLVSLVPTLPPYLVSLVPTHMLQQQQQPGVLVPSLALALPGCAGTGSVIKAIRAIGNIHLRHPRTVMQLWRTICRRSYGGGELACAYKLQDSTLPSMASFASLTRFML
jgi:hypothetical protein